jgi:mono/diheme cytochrome c family protein
MISLRNIQPAAFGLMTCLTWGSPGAFAAEPDLEAGKAVYKDANCIGCHKWHGDGGGGYGGAALSLRETELDKDYLVEVIQCGRPGTRMPFHVLGAYQTVDCYDGLTKADLGAEFPPKAAKLLRDEQIEAVTDYLLAALKGKGEATFEDCIDFWGEGSKQCANMKK